MPLMPLEDEGSPAPPPGPPIHFSAPPSHGGQAVPHPGAPSGLEPSLANSPGIDPRTMDIATDLVQTFRGRIVEAP